MALLATCCPPVITNVHAPGALPRRLEVLGWRHPLYVRGTLDEGAAVAIVGSRAASGLGMERAHALARHLGDHRVHVVSGGAIGIVNQLNNLGIFAPFWLSIQFIIQ